MRVQFKLMLESIQLINVSAVCCIIQIFTHITLPKISNFWFVLDYTILTSNYTQDVSDARVEGLLFRNYCLNDYGSELASFHSQSDDDSYFDIIESYAEHPYGLKFMDCTIGLTNRSYGNAWEWYDGTPYDWGIKGSATDQWDDASNPKEFRCVLINNALSQREWESFQCSSSTDVHCGVCNTPSKRPYLLELSGTWDNTAGKPGFVLLWVQLNGTDLFGNGINSIEFLSINITQNVWSYSETFNNYSNIGPIDTITFLIRNGAANITINRVRINYFKDRAGSLPIHLETEGSSSCNYKTIKIEYVYQNYTIDEGTEYDDACTYGLNFLPTVEPTSHPSLIPSSTPSYAPSGQPSQIPTGLPTSTPTGVPSNFPSKIPTSSPSTIPTIMPSVPSYMPSTIPTNIPSDPSVAPTQQPSNLPSATPSTEPTRIPSTEPTPNPTSDGSNNSDSDNVVLNESVVIIIGIWFGIGLLFFVCFNSNRLHKLKLAMIFFLVNIDHEYSCVSSSDIVALRCDLGWSHNSSSTADKRNQVNVCDYLIYFNCAHFCHFLINGVFYAGILLLRWYIENQTQKTS